MQDVSNSLSQLAKEFEDLQQATAYADASTKYVLISAEAQTEFMNHLNTIDTTDPKQIGDHGKKFINGHLNQKYTKFLEGIPNRQIRQHFTTNVSHALLNFHKDALTMQIGAVSLAQDDNINKVVNSLSDGFKRDASNANLASSKEKISSQIWSLPLSPLDKQKKINHAFNSLYREQVIQQYRKSPEVFGNALSAVYKGQSTPSDNGSLSALVESSGTREIQVEDDQNIKLEGWNNLDPTERRALLNHLVSEDNKANSKKRTDMNAVIKTRDSMYKQGKRPDEKLSLEDLTNIYGVEKGFEIRDLDEFKYNITPDVAKVRLMNETDYAHFKEKANSDIVNADLSVGGLFKAQTYLNDIDKAHINSMKELREDPIKWGIENKQIDPLKFDTPENLAISLSQRSTFAKKVEKEHGLSSPFFNAGEEKLLRDQLVRKPSYETIKMYQNALRTLSDEDKDKAITGFSKIQDKAVSNVATLSSEFSTEAETVANYIILGVKHRKDVEAVLTPKGQSIADVKDTVTVAIQNMFGKLYINNDDANFNKDVEAMTLYLYGKHHAGEISSITKSTVNDNLKAVYGNEPTYIKDSTVLAPRGMKHRDFKDRLYGGTMEEVKKAGLNTINAHMANYRMLGSGKYQVLRHNNPIFSDKGEPVVVDVHKITLDQLRKAREEREERKQYKKLVNTTIHNIGIPDTRDIID
ncbi:hypothetical protein [Candidatus Liberibacter americanus]|uniref:hypothetical protein n=1 Tax=Candidatus Liberibacter americanus TaxID=309868 RepID=UPI0012675334|nr:hypothetical protein [Candidatus Liberibacter americanus]